MTNVIKFLFIISMLFSCAISDTRAQSGEIANPGELQMEYQTRDGLDNLVTDYQDVARMLIGAALFLSLILVIYHVANNAKYGKGKQAVVSWMIAVVIYLIAINIRLV